VYKKGNKHLKIKIMTITYKTSNGTYKVDFSKSILAELITAKDVISVVFNSIEYKKFKTKKNNVNDWSKRRAGQIKAILNNWGVDYKFCKNSGDGITFSIDNLIYENRVLIKNAGFIVCGIGRHDKGTIFRCV
jgi:hypothetical protein